MSNAKPTFTLLDGDWDLSYSRPVDIKKAGGWEAFGDGMPELRPDQFKPPEVSLTIHFHRACGLNVINKIASMVAPGIGLCQRGLRGDDPTTLTTSDPEQIRALLRHAVLKSQAGEGPGHFHINTQVDDMLLERDTESLLSDARRAGPELQSLFKATGLNANLLELMVAGQNQALPDDIRDILQANAAKGRSKKVST